MTMPDPSPVCETFIEEFIGAEGNRLVAERHGTHGDPVLLLHGGGQTRHAWAGSAATLARQGRVAYTLDQRGHGDSDWSPSGDYRHVSFAADLTLVADEIARRHGKRPFAIGASFGGLIALLAHGLAAHERHDDLFRALVFVDISLRTDLEGADRIRAFMRAHAQEGFASVDEAADVVAAYTPHRPGPRSTRGLQKNLRQRSDGRWRWHWDPRFIDGERWIDSDRPSVEPVMVSAARALTVPALLVRGGSSELVQEEHAREFLALCAGIEYVDVAGARHMVVGDANDQFSTTLGDFLDRAAVRA
ncbi:MAG TPA: alpha/beta fold hydrolase [Ramlibacter sp.]|nr:alpha/beta fold hydrolase [Ramlibacter sp.]